MYNRKYAGHAGKAILCATLVLSPAAHAQTTSPAGGKSAANPASSAKEAGHGNANSVAAEIASINERIAVMSARFAELEMQAKIAAKRAEIGKSMETGRSLSFMDETFIPSVREISGIDGKIWAVLNVQNGNTQTVRVGDRVGVWRVVDIRPDSVTVRYGKESVRLSFGANMPQPKPAQDATGAPSALPPFPSR